MVVSTRLNLFAVSVGPLIVTGRYFPLLLPVERDALVAHEMGHIEYRHLSQRLWRIVTGKWMGLSDLCHAQEFEADRYATIAGHGAGLIQFLRRLNPTHKTPLEPTPDERIKNIVRWLQLT